MRGVRRLRGNEAERDVVAVVPCHVVQVVVDYIHHSQRVESKYLSVALADGLDAFVVTSEAARALCLQQQTFLCNVQ